MYYESLKINFKLRSNCCQLFVCCQKKSVWHLSESECHHTLQVDEGHSHRTLFELDVDEGINFTTSVSVTGSAVAV